MIGVKRELSSGTAEIAQAVLVPEREFFTCNSTRKKSGLPVAQSTKAVPTRFKFLGHSVPLSVSMKLAVGAFYFGSSGRTRINSVAVSGQSHSTPWMRVTPFTWGLRLPLAVNGNEVAN